MYRIIKPLKRCILVLAAAFVLSSCSQGFVYDQVPRFALWTLDDYVTLNDAQEDDFMNIVRELMDVQREEHFDLYIDWIDQIKEKVLNNDVQLADMQRWYREGDAYRFDVLNLVAPISADYLLSFNQNQREELLKNLREGLEDDIEEVSQKSNLEWQSYWAERRVENTEDELGKLSEAQKAMIERSVLEQLPTLDDYQEYRLAWLDGFEIALLEGDRDRLVDVMINYKQFYSTPYMTKRQINRSKVFSDLVAMSATLTPKQRERFTAKLDEWRALLLDIQAIR